MKISFSVSRIQGPGTRINRQKNKKIQKITRIPGPDSRGTVGTVGDPLARRWQPVSLRYAPSRMWCPLATRWEPKADDGPRCLGPAVP